MFTEQELVNEAGRLKVKLINRSGRIIEWYDTLSQHNAGLNTINEDRAATLAVQIHDATARQNRDAVIYATMRWILGITDEIDEDNIELDK